MRSVSQTTRVPAPDEGDARPRSRWRWAVSGFLLLHLSAVLIAPFTFATSSGPGVASPAALPVMETLRPYTEAAYLNHGYFFFAPNPGASHLVRYRLEFDDGRPGQELVFPDRQRQWPRLLYHRHLMLSEWLHASYAPPSAPPDWNEDPEELAAWREARRRYEALWQSYQRRLAAAHGASQVTLTRVEHRPPTPYEFLEQGKRLDNPDLYRDLPEDAPAEDFPPEDLPRQYLPAGVGP